LNETEGPFFRAGADGTLIADFRAIADSGRYPAVPVLQWLVKVIVGRGVGPNKDSPLFELCHLVAAVDAFGGGADGRWTFFLGIDPPLPRRIRTEIGRITAGRPPLKSVAVGPDGLRLAYPGGDFEVRYGRMPFLLALYEFLIGMGGYTQAETLAAIFDDLSNGPFSPDAIGKASNALAAVLRAYRRDHLSLARNDEKFDPIHRFLRERGGDREIIVDDQGILDFWLLHSEGSNEFKGYRTVFDCFIRYLRGLAEARRAANAEGAAVIGTDFEAGEIDPAVDDEAGGALDGLGPWRSPFEIFDSEALAPINCFKGVSERRPIEPLMHYGLDALRLPRAFLRLESFGPVQTGITTDLQVKRPRASIERRIGCGDAESYADRRAAYRRLRDHVGQLQKAALHAVTAAEGRAQAVAALATVGDGDLATESLDAALAEARQVFTRLSRRGFEPLSDPDDPRIDAFRLAAGGLVTMAAILERMLAALDRAERRGEDILRWFEDDRQVFSRHFAALYGAVR
jgi:hypothetical protein